MGPGMSMDQGTDIQRRGFHDGMDGARKDMDNHRRPNVNNRDEYRHPNVPRQARNEYRDAFKRGYEQAMSHQMGEPDHR
jgi:ribosome modulation factor